MISDLAKNLLGEEDSNIDSNKINPVETNTSGYSSLAESLLNPPKD